MTSAHPESQVKICAYDSFMTPDFVCPKFCDSYLLYCTGFCVCVCVETREGLKSPVLPRAWSIYQCEENMHENNKPPVRHQSFTTFVFSRSIELKINKRHSRYHKFCVFLYVSDLNSDCLGISILVLGV